MFDERRRVSNIAKHGGFNFAWLDEDYVLAAKISPARDDRFFATGFFDGRLITVVFRRLGQEGVSIISMRPASREERRLW